METSIITSNKDIQVFESSFGLTMSQTKSVRKYRKYLEKLIPILAVCVAHVAD